jgi:hypothetical protein
MTNLETVAAQRDELTMKLRAMARELAELRAEIARMRERYGNTTEPGFGDPIQTAVLEVAPIPAPPEVVTPYSADVQTLVSPDWVSPARLATGAAAADIERGALPDFADGGFVGTEPLGSPAGVVHVGHRIEDAADTPPKPKRSRLFGGKPS